MNKTNESALREQRLAALKAMEIKATDKEDMELCASDMQKFASLDESEARIVASAIRAKHLPSIARAAGLDNEMISEIVEAPEDTKTADFANDNEDDLSVADMPFGADDAEDNDDEDLTTEDEDSADDFSEANDEDIATFQIEVPADMLDAAQAAVQEALDKVLGGDSSEDADMGDGAEDEEPLDADNEMGSDDMADSDEAEKSPLTAFNKVNTMTKQALAQRRAQREEILRTVLAEEGKPFKFDSDAQYKGEEAYPSMTMENSGGNSLQGENPTFAAQRVPTTNPDWLQLGDAIEDFKLEGTPTLEYTMSIDDMDVPSEGADMDRLAPVPTQMKNPANKTTVAMDMEAAEDEEEGAECACCGKGSMGAGMIECPDCGKSFECCESCEGKLDSGDMDCPMCKKVESDVEVNIDSAASADAEAKTAAAAAELQKTAELERARIKVAFGCSYKLALANLINEAEVETYAEQMLNDGLRAEAMIRQTKLMLRSAQSNAERVASAAAEKLSVRTASVGISTSPALTAPSVNSAALDIQSALKGTWTMPRVED